ncbi:MAG: hypothetical protein JSU86_04320 [Phycisphaerales bacterium]|nr:MAG: hypothetical protein JSU86_04320 [Phycisphaerales bacterium]
MTKETITRRPKLAASILLAGAIVYFLLCQPAIWTRGYPRLDPFWRAMPWLWFVPVFISAVYDDDRRRRLSYLVLFAVFVGFTMAGTFGGALTPRHMSLAKMLRGTVFWGPINVGVTLLLERGWHSVLRRVRGFTDEGKCRNCGYLIRHLTIARCPECGTPFDRRWLTGDEPAPEPTLRPWRTRMVAVVLLAVAFSTPPLFHAAAIAISAQRGWAAGKRHWRAGTAVLYIDYIGIPGFAHKHSSLPVDPLSGLPLLWASRGVEKETFERAFNAAVNEELAKAGKRSLSHYVFSNPELERLLNHASFHDIPQLPFRVGELIQLVDGPEGLAVNGSSTRLDPHLLPRQFAFLEEPAGLLVLRCGNELYTMLEDGTLLQYAMVSSSGTHLGVLP